jgi:hypothetical protein
MGTLEQRAYLLLSLAVGGLGASWQKRMRALELWRRFIARHPKFTSPLVTNMPRGSRKQVARFWE